MGQLCWGVAAQYIGNVGGGGGEPGQAGQLYTVAERYFVSVTLASYNANMMMLNKKYAYSDLLFTPPLHLPPSHRHQVLFTWSSEMLQPSATRYIWHVPSTSLHTCMTAPHPSHPLFASLLRSVFPPISLPHTLTITLPPCVGSLTPSPSPSHSLPVLVPHNFTFLYCSLTPSPSHSLLPCVAPSHPRHHPPSLPPCVAPSHPHQHTPSLCCSLTPSPSPSLPVLVPHNLPSPYLLATARITSHTAHLSPAV